MQGNTKGACGVMQGSFWEPRNLHDPITLADRWVNGRVRLNENNMTDLSSLLLGRRLDDVVKHDYSWDFVFSDRVCLRVECLWRLVVSGRLAVTSEDHGHQFGLPSPVDCLGELRRQIIGAAVQDVNVRAGTIDITLGFGSGRTLEVIPTSAGYEAWQVSASGILMVGNPGHEG
jgi:hypothetical protein